MKHLLILLISITSVNYLFGGSQYNACIAGYKARNPVYDSNTGLYVRPLINTDTIQAITNLYNKNIDDQNAALWGYYYNGCSKDSNGTVYIGECDYNVLNLQPDASCGESNAQYGWYKQPGCWPEATQGASTVCSLLFTPSDI